jgi:hypothetical protein
MKKWSVFIACLWAFQVSAQSTYPAAGCSQAQIQAAITAEQAAAADGDIISIPAGNCTWTGSQQINVTFNKSVTIQGAGAVSATTGGASTTGTDQTIILNNTTSGTLFNITTTAGKSFRFTGMALTENGSSPFTSNGILFLSGQSTAVRVDHNHFNLVIEGTSTSLYVGGIVQGVADHNFFDDPNGLAVTFDIGFHNGVGWNGTSGSNSFGSFADTEHWGSSEFFFVEDSQFSNGGVTDAHDGARFVFRHNTVTGSGGSSQQMYTHGLTPDPVAAVRAVEIYDNTFSQAGNQSNPPYSFNSGSLLFWGNSVTGGYQNAVLIGYPFRTTAGGGGNYNYTGNWGYCGTAAGGPTNWDGNLNSSGYPCLMQPGRGAGQLLTGSSFPGIVSSVTGNVAWPHQVLSPAYIWNNTYTPQYYTSSPLVGNNTGGSGASITTDNVDYYQQFGSLAEPGTFNGTAGIGQGLLSARPSTCTAGTDPMTSGSAPGVGYWATDTNTLYVCNPTNTWTVYYTPYTYPHPLTQSSQGASVPAPPTGLVATVQ